MNGVKIEITQYTVVLVIVILLHAVRSAITAIAELFVGAGLYRGVPLFFPFPFPWPGRHPKIQQAPSCQERVTGMQLLLHAKLHGFELLVHFEL